MKFKLYIILTLTLCIKASNGTVKLWIHTTNFEIEKNWDLERLPCSKDTVYFDNRIRDVLLLSSAFSFQEVVLPRNGEIILMDKTKIGIASKSDCKGQDIRYTAGGFKEWYDPSNWKSETMYLVNDNDDLSPIPHTERVPCQYDHIIFPVNSSFQVSFPENSVQINISSLKFDEQATLGYTTEQFNEFREGKTGKAFIKGNTQLNIEEAACLNNNEICACSNSQTQVYTKICKHIWCQALPCSDPIEVPNHHCCPICGARVLFNINPSKYQLDATRRILLSKLKNPSYKNVGCYLWKIWRENSASILCLDRGIDKRASVFVKELSHILSSDDSVNDVRIFFSSQWKDIPDKEDTDLLSILGIIIGIILGIFLIIGAFVVYHKHRHPVLNFVRFDRDVSKVVMELGTTPHEDLQPTDMPRESQGQSSEEIPAPEKEKKGFKNPLAGFKFKTQTFKGYTDMTNPIYGIEEENNEN